jgi:hypothetical protein
MRKSRVFYAGNLGEDAAPLAWHEGAELEEGDWRLCGRRTEPLLHPTSPGLADDLEAAWNATGVTMRARQRLLRTVVVDIIADVDEEAR